MVIYNNDGTVRIVKDEDVKMIETKPEDIKGIVQVGSGVDIILKDGSIQHFSNAKTDGFSIWFNEQ